MTKKQVIDNLRIQIEETIAAETNCIVEVDDKGRFFLGASYTVAELQKMIDIHKELWYNPDLDLKADGNVQVN